MGTLKQSTSPTIKIGPFVDETDGKTAETGLSIAQADVRLSKNGGDFAQKNSAGAVVHDESGYYDVPLDATDTNTAGRLKVAISKAGALPVWQDFLVLPANVNDSLIGGTDTLQVDVVQSGGSTVPAGAIPNAAAGANGGLPTVDASNLVAGIQGTKNQLDDLNDVSTAQVNSQCDTAIADGLASIAQAVWDALTSALTTAGSIGKKLSDWVLHTDNKVLLAGTTHTSAVLPTVTDVTNAVKIQDHAKKNTALSNYMFKLVDDTDGKTPETSVTGITARVSKDGGAFGSLTNSGTITEVSDGWYKIDLAAGDLNADEVVLEFYKTGVSRIFTHKIRTIPT